MEILQECREHAHKYYGDLLIAAEATIADVLFETAERCTTNEDQRRYFEAMQELKSRSGALHTAFQNKLNENFHNFSAGIETSHHENSEIDLSNLALVQRDQLEDELAISVIVSKSNSRNSESLWKLNRRLAVIRGGKAVDDESNPFGPASVCEALHAGMNELAIDNKAKILIYKQLGKIFVISFAKELTALNEKLADKGILANLKFEVANSSSTDKISKQKPEPNQPTEPLVDVPQEASDHIAHQRELYSAIKAMQASSPRQRTQTAGGVSFAGVPVDGTGGQDTFSQVDYALALSAIQQSKAFLSAAVLNKPLATEAVEEKLFGQLAKQGDKDSRHKMTQDDANTVDLVGMIFRYMLEDPNLHDSVKTMLSHLHTPYLKLALIDATFLDDYQHKARVLLNTMAEVGGKWVKKDNDRTVLPKIKTIVETVLKGFVDDDSIFEQLLDDLLRFKENLEKRSQMVEKRNTESQQGLEKLEISKQRATDEFEKRIDDAQIADNVASILHTPWSEFLSFNLLRHGEDSLSWQSALKVVDGVIWSVQPSQVADNKKDFQRHQSDMEKSVTDGLNTIGYDPNASKQLLNSLRQGQELAYHQGLMKEASADGNKSTQQAKIKPASSRKVKKPSEPGLTSEEKEIIERLRGLAFGTWFEFDKDGTAVELKLAWFSRVTQHFMFVDQTGVKQAVENQLDLAHAMMAGTVKIIEPDKKTFMERALEAVFSKLKLAG